MSHPRGDPPGFVRALDDTTLRLPERPGNRLADTLINLLSDPRIALLFLIPGVGDTFRVNGTAVITDDRDLLEASAVDGKAPRLGILISVREAYTQCAKALMRSDCGIPGTTSNALTCPAMGIDSPDLDVVTAVAHTRAATGEGDLCTRARDQADHHHPRGERTGCLGRWSFRGSP